MKKIINITLEIITIFIFTIPTFVSPVRAKTLGDLKNELTLKQEELAKNKEQEALTEQEIEAANKEIENIKTSIEQTYVDIANLTKETEKLNEQIEEKDKQMKEIVNFVQVSSGESAYLEYAFGATDFTDFIYRMAVSEQLASYNEKLIEEYNSLIEENNKKQKEIENKRTVLANKQTELEEKANKLGVELENISDTGLDIEDEIEYQKEIINLYISKGCSENEDIATCGRSVLPAGTAFYRPVTSGRVSSEWGYRSLGWHEGIDMAVSQNTPVYSIGTGMVAAVFYRNSCGGNMVIIHHNINGQVYTSVYAHLNYYTVSKGDIVDRNTIIGYSGGGRNTVSPSASKNACSWFVGTGWDHCSCGEHLHLTVATVLYGPQYTLSVINTKYSIDPRKVINFPATGVSFTDRLTKY